MSTIQAIINLLRLKQEVKKDDLTIKKTELEIAEKQELGEITGWPTRQIPNSEVPQHEPGLLSSSDNETDLLSGSDNLYRLGVLGHISNIPPPPKGICAAQLGCFLGFIAVALGGLHSYMGYRTDLRSISCRENYSSTFSADFLIFLIPCILWALISLGVWSSNATRVGSIVAACFWLWLVSQAAISNEVIKYTACDRKGDESGQALAFAEIYLVPMVWATTSILVILATPAWRLAKRLRKRR